MKHFSKQLSWLLAFVLIFTSVVSTGIPVYASDTITIGESTDEVILAGTNVELYDWGGDAYISYYESADSDTVLYEDTYASTIGSNNIAAKPYAWHITFVKIVQDNSGTARPPEYHFKAYPDTSLENVPVSTQMTLPEGITTTTTTATTGAAINISVYIGDTKLTDYNETSSFTLPSASLLRSYVGETQFNSALETAGYKLPDLTELYYTVELTDKSASSYSLKLTLVPTVEVTFDENTGTPDLAGTKMYATPNAKIDSAKLPTVSKDGVDFYGWKRSDAKYVFLANVINASDLLPGVSSASELKAMYKEINPTFSLDLKNKKVTDLLPGRTYAYPKLDIVTWDDTTIVADSNGEFSYETLSEFENLAQLRLNENIGVSINSNYVSLKHGIPSIPVTENTQTTARVTNTNDFAGCEFAIRATSDSSALSWGTSSTFSGLTPETEYKIYVKHSADENGFESNPVETVAFTTLAVKVVSNDAPNGVTIENISVQAHTNSAIEPVLVIKDGDKTLVEGTDYTVVYSNNTDVGTATATVTFINDYSGTMTKNFTLTHNWQTDWSSDATKHWHECFVCHEKNDEAAHILGTPATATTPQTCTVCGYVLVPALGSWIVSFDRNVGTGTMADVSVTKGEQYTLPACTFTAPANKEFKAWNIGGTEYAPGANYTVTANTTVTAEFIAAVPTNGGGGSSTATPQPDAGTAATKDASNKASREAIKEQLSQTKAGDAVTVEMNGSLVVPGEVLSIIRGKDVTLVLDMGDGITWSINGQSITDSSLDDVDFDVTLDTNAIPKELISQMAEEQASTTLSLSHDGSFGFTAVLTIDLNEINAGKYGNLFYYNPETKQLTLQAVEKIGEKGAVELPFSHASEYVVIISEEPMLEKTLDQIEISAVKRTLYVGGTEKKSMTLKLELPQLLKEAVEQDSSILKITYQSSNPKIATVNASGKITAKKAGKTTITTQVTINGVQRKFKTTITVKKAYIKLIKSTNTLKTGSTFTYKAIGYGVKTEDIMFYTSKKSIVVINKTTGKAKARTKGTDYVIAKAGKIIKKIKVKVS